MCVLIDRSARWTRLSLSDILDLMCTASRGFKLLQTHFSSLVFQSPTMNLA